MIINNKIDKFSLVNLLMGENTLSETPKRLFRYAKLKNSNKILNLFEFSEVENQIFEKEFEIFLIQVLLL